MHFYRIRKWRYANSAKKKFHCEKNDQYVIECKPNLNTIQSNVRLASGNCEGATPLHLVVIGRNKVGNFSFGELLRHPGKLHFVLQDRGPYRSPNKYHAGELSPPEMITLSCGVLVSRPLVAGFYYRAPSACSWSRNYSDP